ncbi:MAG: hypothetical protein AAGE99_02640 [Chlamydiota bacterium]
MNKIFPLVSNPFQMKQFTRIAQQTRCFSSEAVVGIIGRNQKTQEAYESTMISKKTELLSKDAYYAEQKDLFKKKGIQNDSPEYERIYDLYVGTALYSQKEREEKVAPGRFI